MEKFFCSQCYLPVKKSYGCLGVSLSETNVFGVCTSKLCTAYFLIQPGLSEAERDDLMKFREAAKIKFATQGCGECGSFMHPIVAQCQKCGCAICKDCNFHESNC